MLIALEGVGYELDDVSGEWKRDGRRRCAWGGSVAGGFVPGLGKKGFVATENRARGVCGVGMFGEELGTKGGVTVGALGDIGMMHSAERGQRG